MNDNLCRWEKVDGKNVKVLLPSGLIMGCEAVCRLAELGGPQTSDEGRGWTIAGRGFCIVPVKWRRAEDEWDGDEELCLAEKDEWWGEGGNFGEVQGEDLILLGGLVVDEDEATAEGWEDGGADFEEVSGVLTEWAVAAEVLHVEHQHELGVAAGDAVRPSVGEVPDFFAVGETAGGAACAAIVDYADRGGERQGDAIVEVGAQYAGRIGAGLVDDDDGGFGLAGAFEAGYDDALGQGDGTAKETREATRHRHGWADGEGF